MRIEILGCSGGIGPGLRTTSLLVDEEILIDAGTGVGELSPQRQRRIRSVYLTHSHLDHVCGLAFMADNLFGLVEHPLEVFATAPTVQALREHVFNWTVWPDFSALPEPGQGLLRWQALRSGIAHAAAPGLTITAFDVLHTVPAVGYALQDGNGVFAFSGDTYADAALWDSLNALPRLDRLMIEVAFADEQAELGRESRHFTPRLLGSELRRLRHRPRLYLTHHKPGHETRIEQQCREALRGWDYAHLTRGDVITL